MKTRTLVALALLVVVGGLTLWKQTRPDPHVRTHAATQPLSLKKDDIDELEIAEPGKPVVQLKKDGAAWKLVQPVADAADGAAAGEAVDALVELKLRDVIAESPESYEKVGLGEKDTVKVTAKKGGKALATLLVGKTSNVRLDGDPRVFSTANLKRWALVKEPKMWRDRHIVDVPVDTIDRIEVAYPAGKVVAKKDRPPAAPPSPDPKAPPPMPAPATWALVEGAGLLGGTLDGNVPLELANTLARLTADDFADDKTAAASVGLDPPLGRVTVTTTDGKSIVVLVGKADEQKTYVRLDGGTRIWTVQKYEADRIPSSPAQWRDKTVVRLEPAQVTRIEIQKDKDRTLLERVDDKTWKASAPAGLDLDQDRVLAILRATQSLRAAAVLDGADARTLGLDKPRATVTLTRKDGAQVKLTLGADKDGKTPVLVTGQKDAVELSAYQLQPFLAELKKGAAPEQPPM